MGSAVLWHSRRLRSPRAHHPPSCSSSRPPSPHPSHILNHQIPSLNTLIHQSIRPQPNQNRRHPKNPTFPQSHTYSRPALQNLKLPLSQLFHPSSIRVDSEAGENGGAHQSAGKTVVVSLLLFEDISELGLILQFVELGLIAHGELRWSVPWLNQYRR